MGESRGGEGSGRSPRADQVAEAIASEILRTSIDIEHVSVSYVTERCYAVRIQERGLHSVEAFFLHLDEAHTLGAVSPPSGDSTEEGG